MTKPGRYKGNGRASKFDRLNFWRQFNTRRSLNKSASIEKANGNAGYIYVAHLGENLYKIGKTANLPRRQNELSASNPICKIIFSRYTTDARGAEKVVQRTFSNRCLTREVFRLSCEDLEEVKHYVDRATEH